MFGQYYNPLTGKYKINPSYQEILRLDRMLTEADIPHTLGQRCDGWYLCYPDVGDDCVVDVIEFTGSYGCYKDTLEIMGLLTLEEQVCDSVLGDLTAEEVFERIQKHYTGNWDEKTLYTHTDPVLNDRINEIINDFDKVVKKAKSYGLDIKLTSDSKSSLELYFHDDYPDTILVDKTELGM